SRRRHTRSKRDWSSDVCSSDLGGAIFIYPAILVLPTLLGGPSYTPYVASGLAAVQVFFSTLSGAIKARKNVAFSPRLILYMGGEIGRASGRGREMIVEDDEEV